MKRIVSILEYATLLTRLASNGWNVTAEVLNGQMHEVFRREDRSFAVVVLPQGRYQFKLL